MNRKLLIPALVCVNLVAGVSSASAGNVFDFLPRMDFFDQPEGVTKDKSRSAFVCVTSDETMCDVAIKSTTPKLPQDAKK